MTYPIELRPIGYFVIPKVRWKPQEQDKYLVMRYPFEIEFCFVTQRSYNHNEYYPSDVISLSQIFQDSRRHPKNYIGVIHYYESD